MRGCATPASCGGPGTSSTSSSRSCPSTTCGPTTGEFFQDFLRDAQPPYTPEEMKRYIEAWSQPGAATAMINYYRFAVRHSSGEIRPITAPTLVIWGERDRYLGPDARRAPPRRRAQPRPRRAPARRLALGPPRRGRARQPAAHRLLRPRPGCLDHVTGGADVHDGSPHGRSRVRDRLR